MDNITLFSRLNATRFEMMQYYLEVTDKMLIWQLAEKGFLFKLFQAHASSGFHLDAFYKKVHETIGVRKSKLLHASGIADVAGKYLLFDPGSTMYDGLAELTSKNFFDSDDVPPPEFWLGIENAKLVSFIPSDFISQASQGIDNCLSGCLEWVEA